MKFAKYSWILVVILAIIIVSAFLFFIFRNKAPNCDVFENVIEKDNCLFNFAVSKGDSDVCMRLSEGSDACLIQIAASFGKFELCDRVENEQFKQNCLFSKTISEGIKGCAGLEQKNENESVVLVCYATVLMSEKVKHGDCELIVSDTMKSYCNAIFQEDVKLCNQFSEDAIVTRNSCILQVVIKTKNKGLCNQISDEVFLQQCESLI